MLLPQFQKTIEVFSMLNPKKFDKMVKDTRCRENEIRPIDKKQCRNNCSHYDGIGKKCMLGYLVKPKKKKVVSNG
jgi:hypothetical protein